MRQDVPAGRFSSWLEATIRAQETDGAADVPCGDCSACCTSSYFVHIEPDETSTVERIPPALLFPAPGLPDGHLVLGYDRRGHCPMLVAGRCSIYEDRPRTCRRYDCRVFAAADVAPEETSKALIAQRVQRWAFDAPTELDRDQRDAVRAAAVFLRERPECFHGIARPRSSRDVAMFAVRVHALFLPGEPAPDVDAVRAALRRGEKARRAGRRISPRATAPQPGRW